MASSQWVFIPVSLAFYNLVIPQLLGISYDACAIVSLFVSASLLVSCVVDERAMHNMFFMDPADPTSRGTLKTAMRAFHWFLGAPLLMAMLKISDLQVAADGGPPTHLVETPMMKLCLAFSFLSLTYLAAVFCFFCSENRQAGFGPFAAAMAPAATYTIMVAYVTMWLNSSLWPLIVTTDTGVALSFPLIHALLLTRFRTYSDKQQQQKQKRRGSYSSKWMARPSTISGPFVGYAICLLASFRMASPRTLAILLALVPRQMLHASQDLFSFGSDSLSWDLAGEVWNKATTLLDLQLQLSVRDALLASALFALLVLKFAAGTSGGSPEPTGAAGGAAAEAQARRRLAKLRANSEQFPPPFPNGWYHICVSDDVLPDRAVAASACNKEFAVFRDEDGEVVVMHAFCPHLGTHLGHGGLVENGQVKCPYHSWVFNKEGKCVDIPYCPKKPGEKTHNKVYPARERLGMVFVWLHADNEEPNYEITLFDEIEESMEYVVDVPVKNWYMHNMEPSQNAADPYHFNTVHQWLGANDMHGSGGWLWGKHSCKSRLALLGHTGLDGKPLPETVIQLDEECNEVWLFGLIPLPSFFSSHFSSGASFQGPQVSVFRVNTCLFGSCRIVFTFTPEAPFEQRCCVRVFKTRGFPHFLAAQMGKYAVKTVNQDREVWEHKLAVAPRNVVAGDGPFAAYGTWLRQFYSKSSQQWGDTSLDW
mmetsp:Transcript_98776/g.205894  ORF Transcript_98776/g.205894 Transcript_98776/m.205894 type:complete len:706 (+) Transcript_98776:103-2220(+)|eukprot:CAMPEP_0206494316 /NCGR_PEP_ID=MMETSP0324_2-20121206/47644_1 /ASSEMBLY_ACC=CAM_ASM_000836 /TAXON_ID=2866 /ORGANISM="Crypthecodinium cohnii, Strain Seligo" /LENGTH=705 /DNA_ID=CAMNT_0053977925 /DNA_START=20 /DNA_END=2137 /DNA_ORIENTATION=-